jgi:hypothetical protein
MIGNSDTLEDVHATTTPKCVQQIIGAGMFIMG